MHFRQFDLRRSQILSAFIMPAVLLLFASRSVAASSSSEDTSAVSIKQGSEIFHTRCIVCHNKQPGDNTPFAPPNLYTVFGPHPLLTPQQVEAIVTHGRGQMPTFGPILSRTEIRSVIAYLRKRAAAGAPKKQ